MSEEIPPYLTDQTTPPNKEGKPSKGGRGRKPADHVEPFPGKCPSNCQLMAIPVPEEVVKKMRATVKRIAGEFRLDVDEGMLLVEVAKRLDWDDAMEMSKEAIVETAKKFIELKRQLDQINLFGFKPPRC